MFGRLLRSMRSSRALRFNDEGIRHWHDNRIEDAARSFRRAVAANPFHAPSWNSLAAALMRLGRGGDAIEYFRRAVAIDPDNVDFLVNLGEASSIAGLPEMAIDALQEALQRNPEHARAHAALLRP